MEKVDLSDVECSSSTKIGSHYSGNNAKHGNYTKSHAHGRGGHHHDTNSYGNPRQNQVSNVLLFGIPIVALIMDGKERLCLAQISSTLLKDFSYNEIHNRRVALGINCIQCTPVQLEILRRAGAMPVTSRRCGMITKREAERLCQSFLGDHAPPQLPENFAFDVFHECAWGCRGSFVPSRYNSSRAKCIRCTFCQLFFSPNKFIFHSHRLPTSRYVQPDAANFNSWRRHLKLCNSGSNSGTPAILCGISLDAKGEEVIGSSTNANSGDSSSTASNAISSTGILQTEGATTVALASTPEIVHAWEDVKAMFNGGTRKRLLAVHSIPTSSPSKQDHGHGQDKNCGPGKKSSGSSNSNLKRSAHGSTLRASPLQFQQQQQQTKQARQSQLYPHPHHQQNSPFPVNLNHHQFALAAAAAASSSFAGGLGSSNSHSESTRNHNHTIWNPANDDHHSKSGNNSVALNEIIHAAINLPHQQHQQPIHPTGISAVLNPFPWFHRNLVSAAPPPLFPFSHPFGPTYKYLSNQEPELSAPGTGKMSAFKPILPMAQGPVSQLELGRIAGPGFNLHMPTSSAEYQYLQNSTSSWLSSPSFSSANSHKKDPNMSGSTEGFGLPEDLSLNSAGGSVHHSSCSGSSPSSSNNSSSYSPAEYKTSPGAGSLTEPSKPRLSPPGQLDGHDGSSDCESSDVDITDNEDEGGFIINSTVNYPVSANTMISTSPSQKKKPRLLCDN